MSATSYKNKTEQNRPNSQIPTMHLSHIPQCTIQIRNVHISVLNGALWDIGQVNHGICECAHFVGYTTGSTCHIDNGMVCLWICPIQIKLQANMYEGFYVNWFLQQRGTIQMQFIQWILDQHMKRERIYMQNNVYRCWFINELVEFYIEVPYMFHISYDCNISVQKWPNIMNI